VSAQTNLSRSIRTLVVRVPLPPKRPRRGRKFIIGPDGITRTGPRVVVVDNTIVKALGRAHRWKALLESGEYASLTELAKAEQINLSYICRVLRLTLLAPDLMESLLDGSFPQQVQISELVKPMPAVWAEQRTRFKKAAKG
jgi:hypothetical protein